MFKKFVAGAFALVMCCGTISFLQVSEVSELVVSAEDYQYSGSCGENCTYSFDEITGTLTISGTGEMKDYSDYDTPWDNYKDMIKTIIVEDSVTSIGAGAFKECTNLTTVKLSDSITSIDWFAFTNCTLLNDINISKNISKIEWHAFDGTALVENQTSDFVMLGTILYRYQGSKDYVTIPDGVTSIGMCAFYGNDKIISVNIPESVTHIGDNAFSECSKLTEITIPNSVTEIDMGAFRYCYSLTSITIPNSITSINSFMFEGSTELKQVILPDSITSIDYGAFRYCTSLEEIAIPDNVTSIDSSAFDGCYTNFTIYGYKGSTAETYATENDMNFVAIGEVDTLSVTDILNLKKYILDISQDGTGLDLNGDGNVNILDLVIAKDKIS